MKTDKIPESTLDITACFNICLIDFQIFNSGTNVYVRSFTDEITDVLLYDISGRLIARTLLNPLDITTIKTTLHQVYIVKVKGKNHKLTKQIVIK